jgi:hypothetical protein
MYSSKNVQKFAIEFISVFIAVFLAFALNNWNENRRDRNAEVKILSEISNGLVKDIEDIQVNMRGHNKGILACKYWRKAINGQTIAPDSVQYYYQNLTRDFITIQNISGYETLKSKGLEIIKSDSLRFEIISLYEYNFTILQKLEEEYAEMQFQDNYFKEINSILAPYFDFSKSGQIIKLNAPLYLNKNQKKILLSYLWKIELNRRFAISAYAATEKRVRQLIKTINEELESD